MVAAVGAQAHPFREQLEVAVAEEAVAERPRELLEEAAEEAVECRPNLQEVGAAEVEECLITQVATVGAEVE